MSSFQRKRGFVHSWIWAFSFTCIPSCISSSYSSKRAPFDPRLLRSWVRSRCNGGGLSYIRLKGRDSSKTTIRQHQQNEKGCAMWVYEGSLVDPSNGRTIAQVEGLELVRHLTECYNTPHGLPAVPQVNHTSMSTAAATVHHHDSQESSFIDSWQKLRGLHRLGDLAVKDILTNPANHHRWDYATTILSRKLFCYMAPLSSPSSSSSLSPVPRDHKMEDAEYTSPPIRHLLSSFRLRPTSPIRKIPIQQSTALYDTATTFISCNRGRDLWIHTEFPDGRWCLGSALTSSSTTTPRTSTVEDGRLMYVDNYKHIHPNQNFDFQVYVRASSPKETAAPLIFHSNSHSSPDYYTSSQSNLFQKIRSHPWKKTSSISSDSSTTTSAITSASTIPLIISPPRSKLFQWGKDSFMDQLRKYGSSRETYSYSMEYPPFSIPTYHNRNNLTILHHLLDNLHQSFSSFTQDCIHHGLIQPIQTLGDRLGLWDHHEENDSLSIFHRWQQQQQQRKKHDSKSAAAAAASFLYQDLPPIATKCSLRYTRFGESPPWYGIGRMCTLELIGQKVSSTLDVPPLVSRVAATQIPGFMSVYTSIPNEPIITTIIPWKTKIPWNHDHSSKSITLSQPVETVCPESIDTQLQADQDAIRAVSWFRGKLKEAIPLQMIDYKDKI